MKKVFGMYWWALTKRTLDYDDQHKDVLPFREAWSLARRIHESEAKHFIIEKECGCRRRWWGTPLLYCMDHSGLDDIIK